MSDRPAKSEAFLWHPQPEAWQWLQQIINQASRTNPAIKSLRAQLLMRTGTRLIDWIDHVALTREEIADATLADLGFRYDDDLVAWRHDAGLFPWIVRPREPVPRQGLGIKVDSVTRFLQARARSASDASPRDLAWAVAAYHDRYSLTVVERHGHPGGLGEARQATPDQIAQASRLFTQRPRPRDEAAEGFDQLMALFDTVTESLGRDWACSLFFACERVYWQSRNRAAQLQYRRQDELGMGWANHDHHTYRCSREHFASLVRLLERMGFRCRERFFAGAEAGWGAQVLHHPNCRLVVFADVDLSAEEVSGDFAHDGLQPRKRLGTVGLWCRLHGESMMSAGMHHLECQFDFDEARRMLAEAGVESMSPFTDCEYLRQAFTVGEHWPVDAEHLNRLVAQDFLTPAQAAEFRDHGALGSHLEILERNDGYQGFNQTGISQIISQTDPRRF